jgi:hypothetical protein
LSYRHRVSTRASFTLQNSHTSYRASAVWCNLHEQMNYAIAQGWIAGGDVEAARGDIDDDMAELMQAEEEQVYGYGGRGRGGRGGRGAGAGRGGGRGEDGKKIRAANPAGQLKRLFWGAHQRFFRYMCMASKVPSLVAEAKRALEQGQSVVVGLQTTGEASTRAVMDRAEEDELEDFVSG